jgi:hypothetical protein
MKDSSHLFLHSLTSTGSGVSSLIPSRVVAYPCGRWPVSISELANACTLARSRPGACGILAALEQRQMHVIAISNCVELRIAFAKTLACPRIHKGSGD